MRRVLSTVVAVALLLGLGAVAVLALPNGNAMAPVSAAAPEFNPDSPAASQNYNTIGMPLNAAGQFVAAGYQFNADGLAKLIGGGTTAGVVQVLKWDPAGQRFLTRLPGVYGPNFNLAVGEAYWVLLDNTVTATTVSFVGDVPDANTIKNVLVGAASCQYTNITIPLEQASITNADQLAASINAKAGATVVTQVLNWDAVGQRFQTRLPGVYGPNFTVSIGYPYFVCATQAVTWP
jgi:hypothetical protein